MTTLVNRAMGYQSTQNLNVIVEKHASLVKKSGMSSNCSITT